MTESGGVMTGYKELFISQDLGYSAYAAVIYDYDAEAFYNALFNAHVVGGGISYPLENKGTPIRLDQVRKLANKSEDSRADKYIGITEDNWRELVGA